MSPPIRPEADPFLTATLEADRQDSAAPEVDQFLAATLAADRSETIAGGASRSWVTEPPPSYRKPEQDAATAQQRKEVEAMSGPEVLGEFGRHALSGIAGALSFPAEVAKPALQESPEEAHNPIVQGFAAAKAGPLPAPTPAAPGPSQPTDVGSVIARMAEKANPVPLIEQAAKATWDPRALGDVAGMAVGGEAVGAFNESLSGPQLSFSKEVMAPKDATAARAFGSKDPYTVLGLDPKTATEAEVGAALRNAGKQWHPDLHQGDPRANDVMTRYGEAALAVRDDIRKRAPAAEVKPPDPFEAATAVVDQESEPTATAPDPFEAATAAVDQEEVPSAAAVTNPPPPETTTEAPTQEDNVRAAAADRLAFPLDERRIAELAKVKGISVDRAAANLKAGGYTVTPEMLEKARSMVIDEVTAEKEQAGAGRPSEVTAPEASPPPERTGPALEDYSAQPAMPYIKGKSGTMLVTDATGKTREVPYHYGVTEAENLQPSHVLSGETMVPNAAVPEEVQRRTTLNREFIESKATDGTFNPREVAEPSPTPEMGPPVVLPQGAVPGGNHRAAIVQRVYENGSGAADRLKAEIGSRAAEYGIAPEEIANLQHPAVARVLEQPPATGHELAQLSDDLNRTRTQAMTGEETAVVQGEKVSPETMDHFGTTFPEDGTMADYQRTAAGREFVQRLRDDGAIPADQAKKLLGTGGLTDEGRRYVENLVLGRAVPDATTLAAAPLSLRGRLMKAAPWIAMGQGEWDIRPTLTEAVRTMTAARDSGMTVGDYLGQGDLLGGAEVSPRGARLARFLEDAGTTKAVTEAFRKWASFGRASPVGQEELLPQTAPAPTGAFADTFGAPIRSEAPVAEEKAPKEVGAFRDWVAKQNALVPAEKRVTPFDTADVVRARARQDQLTPTSTIQTPERDELRQRVADQLYGDGAATKGQRADIVMGPPGAGKTTIFVDPLAKAHGSLVIDADEAKKLLPEYAASGGRLAGNVHKESSDIVEQRVLPKAIDAKDNVVLSVVGKGKATINGLIDELKRYGYEVHLHLASVPPKEAALRAVKRFYGETDSRFVDPRYILQDVGDKPLEHFNQLKTDERVSSYEHYSNAVPPGSAPRLIERGRGPGTPEGRGRDVGAGDHPGRPEGRSDARGAGEEGSRAEKEPAQPVEADLTDRARAALEADRAGRADEATSHRTAVEAAISQHADEHGIAAAESLRGRIWAAAKNESGRLGFQKRTQQNAPTTPLPEPGGIQGERPKIRPKDLINSIRNTYRPWVGGESTAGVLRQEGAKAAQSLAQAHETLRKVVDLVDQFTRADQVAIWDAGERWSESGQRDRVEALDPALPGFVDEVHGVINRLTQELSRLGLLEAHIEDYLGRFWVKNKAYAQKLTVEVLGKIPYGAKKSFQFGRTYERFVDGLNAGEVPATYNFAEAQLAKIAQMLEAIQQRESLNVLKELDTAKPVMLGKDLPTDINGDPWQYIERSGAHPAFVVYAPREGPGETVTIPSKRIAGYWAAPKSEIPVWKNYLSKGLVGKAWYDAAMALKTGTGQVALGLSGFHGIVIGHQAMVAETARAIEKLVNDGDVTEAAKAAGSVLTVALRGAWKGRQIMEEYRKPGAHPEFQRVLDTMIKGGYRGTAKGELWTGDEIRKFKLALRQAFDQEAGTRQVLKARVDAVWHGLWAALETTTMPILGKYVPWQKTYATYKAVADEVEKAGGWDKWDALSETEQRKRTWDIVRQMDYRFGQVVYDNFFMSNTAKHIAQLVFLAPGWHGGTLSLAAGGVKDVGRAASDVAGGGMPKIGRSGSYWLAELATLMLLSGLATYWYTGEKPQGMDYLAFRDGTTDPNGNPNRKSLPGYVRTMYGWVSHSGRTAANALSAPIRWINQVLVMNRNRHGDQIYDPMTSWPETLREIEKYTQQEYGPISLSQIEESKRRGERGSKLVPNLVGVNPAPRELQRTPAENLMADYLATHGHPSLTPEEADAAAKRREIRTELREGRATIKDLETAVKAHTLTVPEAKKMYRENQQQPSIRDFKELQLDEAMAVYQKASPDQRRLWYGSFLNKIGHSVDPTLRQRAVGLAKSLPRAAVSLDTIGAYAQ